MSIKTPPISQKQRFSWNILIKSLLLQPRNKRLHNRTVLLIRLRNISPEKTSLFQFLLKIIQNKNPKSCLAFSLSLFFWISFKSQCWVFHVKHCSLFFHQRINLSAFESFIFSLLSFSDLSALKFVRWCFTWNVAEGEDRFVRQWICSRLGLSCLGPLPGLFSFWMLLGSIFVISRKQQKTAFQGSRMRFLWVVTIHSNRMIWAFRTLFC